jgi:hypothetical protein
MPYFGVKKYGSFIRDLAIRFNESENIFDGARLLQDYSDRHFTYLREAFIELYDKDSYPLNQKIVTHLFDQYVISDDVKTAFFSRFFSNDDDLEIEFIDKDIDYAYEMLRQIQLPLYAFEMTAHPERYSKEHVKISIDDIIKYVIQDTEEAKATFRLASLSVAIKDRLRLYAQQQAAAAKQETTQVQEKQENKPGDKLHEKNPSQESQLEKPDNRTKGGYTVKKNERLLKIHDYLVKTNVLLPEAAFHDFINMVINADASKISVNKKWKFISCLRFVSTCVDGDQNAWERDICASIGKKRNDLTRCADKDLGWHEGIIELVKQYNN